jgi:hypothetical protein
MLSARFNQIARAVTEVRVFLLAALALRVLMSGFGAALRERLDIPNKYHPFAWLDVWGNYDTGWYIDIARFAYSAEQYPQTVGANIAFPPLYPWLMQALHAASFGGLSYFLAGLLIANVAFFISIPVFYGFLRLTFDDALSRRVLWIWLLSPLGFIFGTAMTEALFLLWLLILFGAVARGREAPTLVAGFAAGLTRVTSAFVVPALWVEAWQRPDHRWHWWLLTSAGIGFGWLLFHALIGAVTGNPLAFFEVEKLWGNGFAWPWETLVSYAGRTEGEWKRILTTGFTVLPSIAVVWLARRRLRTSWMVWVGIVVLVSLFNRSWLSVPRYFSVLFPVYIAAGIVLERLPRPWWYVLLVLSLAAQVFLFSLWATDRALII